MKVTLFVFCFDHPSTFFPQRRVQSVISTLLHFSTDRSLRALCILLIRLTTSMRSVRAPHWLQGFDMSPCQVSTRNTHKVYVLQFLYRGDAKSTCCRMCKEVHRLFNWKYQNTLDFARFLGHLKNDLDTPHPILLSS